MQVGISWTHRLLAGMLAPLPSVRRAVTELRSHDAELIAGKRILVTGGSSGIGRAVALRIAQLGGELILVARGAAELDAVRDEIGASGGVAHALTCDLTDADAVAALASTVTERWGGVDILVNNAGHSIRRTVADSCDRLHDYERTMAVNYFGPVALTLKLLPGMLDAGSGHIVNVATWGVPAETMPKFSAYHASKSALSAFGRSLGAEVSGTGIHVSTVHVPLVRTPMIAPTADYDAAPALTPDDAAAWILTAIRTRVTYLRPRYVSLIRAVTAVSPALADKMVVGII